MRLTKDQQRALVKLLERDGRKTWPNYRALRRVAMIGPGCIMVAWANMWVGIEPDGYTHT